MVSGPKQSWFLFFSRPNHTPKEIAFSTGACGKEPQETDSPWKPAVAGEGSLGVWNKGGQGKSAGRQGRSFVFVFEFSGQLGEEPTNPQYLQNTLRS